jgi:alkanesulfonate monooxygenase SsuD/methylene tetrahydromethanopterin reductase-like flavin-dependent oxidoreductase (luciferase family)
MFGVRPGDHDARYRQGQEWLDLIRMIWERDDFDFQGEFFNCKGIREKPKPFGGTRPLIMNAGSSPQGRGFALRNCDAWFTTVRLANREQADIEQAARVIQQAKDEARGHGHEIGAYTVGVVVCRPTHAEALEYHHHVTQENADWSAIDKMVEGKGFKGTPEELERYRRRYANGKSGLEFFGTPDEVAAGLASVNAAGFTGIGLSFVNYADEFPYFRQEILPRLERLGLRKPAP